MKITLRNTLICFTSAAALMACSNASEPQSTPAAPAGNAQAMEAPAMAAEAAMGAMGAGAMGAMGAGMAAPAMAAQAGGTVRTEPTDNPIIPNQVGDLTPVPLPKVSVADASARPNVIYILVDDFGVGDVSYNGSEISTPNLDQMTKDGVELDRFYSFPICSPTRAALMTGRSAVDYGVIGPLDDRYVAAPDTPFLPQYFKAAGYDTWMVGKWHLGLREIGAFPIGRGFDYHYGMLGGFVDFFTHIYWDAVDWQRNGKTVREEGHATDLLTDDAIGLIEGHNGENPFFMYLAYNAPHTPLQYREGATKAYDGMENEHRKVYAQMVDHMDEAVGEVRAALEAKGIADNTLLVFTSDNGGAERLGSSNGLLREGKGSVYEGGMRVPGLAVWPGKIPAGDVIDYPIFVQNWAPTLMEAAGINVEDDAFTGTSAWPALSGQANAPLPSATFMGSVQGNAVYDWPYKLVSGFALRGATVAPTPELYNVVEDPYEETNLAESQPEIYQRLLADLAARPKVQSLAETGTPPEFLYRGEDGNVNYNIRLKELTPPMAERAKGNGG